MNIVGRLALGGLVLIVVSCQPKSPLSEVTGNVSVLIPKPGNQNQSYTLEPVQLDDIKVLKEVRGNYAEFYYSPGANEGSLYGSAPRARFSKSKQGFYIPIDVISSQMATIYFHIQNLIQLNESVGLEVITRKPFQVGLEVRKSDKQKIYEKNNAFYDGYSDSMLFLPTNTTELSLALNAGVIAHEFFHSIFYKKVLRKLKIADLTSSEKQKAELSVREANLFNLTYVRGLNEGLADFWGWLYTKDANFMNYSFAGGNEGRSLELKPDEIGVYVKQDEIHEKIQSIILSNGNSNDPDLLSYIYLIGTPHARFLRRLVDLEQPSSLLQKLMYRIENDEKKWIRLTIDFLDQLAVDVEQSAEKEISAARLFEFVAERSNTEELLNLAQCDLVLSYLQSAEASDCVKKEMSGAYEIKQ